MPRKSDYKTRPKFYCGEQDEVPDDYVRRGSRYECLKKGIGVGIHLPKKKKSRRKGESDSAKEKRFSREEWSAERSVASSELSSRERKEAKKFSKKDEHEDFLERNFNKAKKKARSPKTGDIFKQLAILWKLENEESESESDED